MRGRWRGAAEAAAAPPYDLRDRLAYWTSVVWLEASVLFSVASALMLFCAEWPPQKTLALVDAPFMAGACLFTLGAYLGCLSAVNANDAPWEDMRWLAGPKAWRLPGVPGYFIYLVGTLFFGWDCAAALAPAAGHALPGGVLGTQLLVWAPGVVGSLCFIAGGAEECRVNRVPQRLYRALAGGRGGGRGRGARGGQSHGAAPWDNEDGQEPASAWRSVPVALSLVNLAGGCLFLWGSIGGMLVRADWVLGQQLHVASPFLLGSLCYVLGSTLMLCMWKREQYGLGMVASLNTPQAMPPHDTPGAPPQVRWNHFGFVHTSSVCAALAVVDLLFAAARRRGSVPAHEAVRHAGASTVVLMLTHGVMALGAEIHRTPKQRPYGALVRFMRLTMLLLAFHLTYSVVADAVFDD